MSNFSTNSVTEISRGKLQDFLNLSTSKSSICSSKCKTNTHDSSSSSSSSSSSPKYKSRRHKSKLHKSKSCKSKCASSTYTTTINSSGSSLSSSCPTTSSSSCRSSSSSCPTTSSSSSCCPSTSSSSCHSTSSSSCPSSSCPSSSCRVKCPSYALKCNTYKSVGGTVLIPGPQGPSSGSLANFSGITNNVQNTPPTITYSIYGSQVNITDSSGTLTFNLTGKYLFQYNITVENSAIIQLTINGTTNFGIQTASVSGNYGCSVIQDLNAGDTVRLNISGGELIWSFASLTVIKL